LLDTEIENQGVENSRNYTQMATKPGLVGFHLTLEEIIDDEDNYMRDLLFIFKRSINSPLFCCSDSKIIKFQGRWEKSTKVSNSPKRSSLRI